LPGLPVSIGLLAVDVPAGSEVLATLGVGELVKLVGEGVEVGPGEKGFVSLEAACRATTLTTAWTA
jgi:hypothetical protein